jgi:alpha-beta hydrolase superfamily lysophospholipase
MMAFQAYNFTHFYAGVPKPKKPEEMSTKEKLSSIFFGVKYPKAIVVDSLHIPHQTILIKTEDGINLQAWYANAETDDAIVPHKGTVLIFHGHGSSKAAIIKEAEAFYQFGYNVLMVDFRNHGNSEGNTTTIGYVESKDVKAAYDYIQSKGEKNIVLYGISMGAATIMKSINDYNLKPGKVILEMPFGSLYDAVKGRMRTFHLPEQPFSALLTFWGGTEQRFWAFGFEPWDYATKINCPVLLQWGMNDPRVTEAETNHIFKNLASHQKQMIKYMQSAHESLCKKENAKWVKTVGDFLKIDYTN